MTSVNDNTLTAEGLLDHYKRVLARTRDRPLVPPVPIVTCPPRPAPLPLPLPPKRVVALPPPPPPRVATPDALASTGVPNARGARRTVAPILVKHGLVWADIIRDDRRQELVFVRREVYYALRGLGWSYPIIAQLCERDHSSVHYAVQKWAEHLTKQATGE